MTEYMISFPSAAMDFPDEEFQAVSDAAFAFVQEARAAGVLLFTGGIDEDVEPILVAGDGTVTDGGYPQGPDLKGGYAILRLDSRDEAIEWAAKIATACRCSQEVRQFQPGRMASL
jgi:hypothetical protein